MSFWPKSRYTASLEQQVTELKAEKQRLEAEIAQLRTSNQELTQNYTDYIHANAGRLTAGGDKPKDIPLPKVGNWLRTRSTLETPNQIVREVEPEQEKTANGSR